jgi:transposase
LAKYTTQFKLEAVQKYLCGTSTYTSIAQQAGVDRRLFERWVRSYQLHGLAGLEKKFSHYDVEFKLSVLRHMWSHDLTYGQTAAAFNIRSAGCIPDWERCYHGGGINALKPHPRGRPKKMPVSKPPAPKTPIDDEVRSREDLLTEVNYLRMENAYLKKLKALVQQQAQPATARKKRK